MVKYSFIIPVYNSEEYLEECVDSIRKQTNNYCTEIILVDDGSKDRSGIIADELAKKYDEVICYHKTNGGAASARNYGLKKSSGRYVMFVDCDDTLDSSLMESVDSIIESNQSELIVYGMSFDYYIDNRIDKVDTLSCSHSGEIEVSEILDNYVAFFQDNTLSSVCNKVFDSNVIRNRNVFFNEKMNLYEDYAFVTEYMANIDSVWFLAEPYYHYRLHKNDNHLHKLVYDIDNLKSNMSELSKSLICLQESGYNSSNAIRCFSDLNIDLLSLHLFLHHYSKKQICDVIKFYFDGFSIVDNGSELYENIMNEDYGAIHRNNIKRQYASKGKSIIKRIIKK